MVCIRRMLSLAPSLKMLGVAFLSLMYRRVYKDMVDSYIIELKYCKSQTTDEQVKKLFEEASVQISRYADSDMVRVAVKTTKLHKLVVIYRGAEMVACEEI